MELKYKQSSFVQTVKLKIKLYKAYIQLLELKFSPRHFYHKDSNADVKNLHLKKEIN